MVSCTQIYKFSELHLFSAFDSVSADLFRPFKVFVSGDGIVADVVVEPLEKGMGVTIGNALRRVLLSHVRGVSVVCVKIAGVLHEFDTISGVREDVAEIIVALKQLAIRFSGTGFRSLKINASGPRNVLAGDIIVPHDVEIVNKDMLICSLAPGAELKMEIIIAPGRGYVPASEHQVTELHVGAILIDSLFCPVKKVSFKVDHSRVGQATDYDKLLMSITTNGVVTVEEAISEAANILVSQIKEFADFSIMNDVHVVNQDNNKSALSFDPVLLRRVEYLELSLRPNNCLTSENIVYIGDLVQKKESDLLKTPNFGKRSADEIKSKLAHYNLSLGMEIPGWPPENIEELAKMYDDQYAFHNSDRKI